MDKRSGEGMPSPYSGKVHKLEKKTMYLFIVNVMLTVFSLQNNRYLFDKHPPLAYNVCIGRMPKIDYITEKEGSVHV